MRRFIAFGGAVLLCGCTTRRGVGIPVVLGGSRWTPDASRAPKLSWHTVESGQPVTLWSEPARSGWQKFGAHFLELFPLDREL